LDDYVSGALTIYIDIIRLFLYILMSARRQRTWSISYWLYISL